MTYAGAEAANVAMLKPLTAGMGAAAAAGGQLVYSIQAALILATALARVPFYALMVSPSLLVIGLAIVLAPFLCIIDKIAGLL